MSENNNAPEVLTPNLPGKAALKTDAPKRAWFPDEAGYQGEPIEYGGALFYSREVSKADIKAFARASKNLQDQHKALAKEQEKEIAALDEGAELSDDRLDYYDAKTEKLIGDLDAAYNDFLSKGIVGWSLPRPFSLELLYQFSKADKVALCEAVGSISMVGMQAAKNAPRRLNR